MGVSIKNTVYFSIVPTKLEFLTVVMRMGFSGDVDAIRWDRTCIGEPRLLFKLQFELLLHSGKQFARKFTDCPVPHTNVY